MTAAKIAVTMPQEVLARAKEHVKRGRAKSLSALVAEAVDEKVRTESLEQILDAMDAERGPPSKAAQAWARRLLKR